MRIHRNHFGFTGLALAVACVATVAVVGLLGVQPADAADAAEGARAAYGKTVYRVYCASCHGAEARGDGKLAEYLTIKPSDLTLISARNDGEFPSERMRQIIDGREKVAGHSSAEMPVWGDAFQKADALEEEPPEVREREVARKVESLLAYLRSIQVED